MENLELVRSACVAWTIIQLQTSRVPSPITSPPFSVQRMLDLDHNGFQHKLSELVHQTTLEFILGDVPAATSARIRSCGADPSIATGTTFSCVVVVGIGNLATPCCAKSGHPSSVRIAVRFSRRCRCFPFPCLPLFLRLIPPVSDLGDLIL